ncbi:hypothetical protein GCM10023317_60530 [Actinopolymorpha pittospori]
MDVVPAKECEDLRRPTGVGPVLEGQSDGTRGHPGLSWLGAAEIEDPAGAREWRLPRGGVAPRPPGSVLRCLLDVPIDQEDGAQGHEQDADERPVMARFAESDVSGHAR